MNKHTLIFLVLFFTQFSLNLESQNTTLPSGTAPAPISEKKEEIKNDNIPSEDFVKTFKYGTPTQKMSTISRIKTSRREADIKLLSEHFIEETNPQIKIEIIRFFSQVKNDYAKTVINYAIKDESEDVRKEAYPLCSIYPDSRYEDTLNSELKNQTGSIRDAIINALSSIKSTQETVYIIELYNKVDTPSSTKTEILRYISETKIPEGEAIAVSAAMDRSESAFVRYMAVVALKNYPTKENYDNLTKLMKEDDPAITARVLYTLSAFSAYGNVKELIIESAKSDNENVRLYAVKALRDYKNESYVKELLFYRLKTDSNEAIALEIIDIYSDYLDDEMLKAVKDLAEFSANKKLNTKAREVLDKLGIEYKKK